jgi:hypothetical protein
MAQTADDRHRRAAKLCRRLSADLADIAPPGFGRAAGWDDVAGVSDAFLDVLHAWERSETPAAEVAAAYDRVLDAWRRAAGRYEARPEVAA